MTAPEPDAAGAPAPTIREVFDRERERLARESVSYTHLTLPTKLEV